MVDISGVSQPNNAIVLGESTVAGALLVTGTPIWAGGTADFTAGTTIDPTNNAQIIAFDKTIVADYTDHTTAAGTGALIFTASEMIFNDGGGGASSNAHSILRDFTFKKNDSAYFPFGNWRETATVFHWDDVRLRGRIATTGECGLSPFVGNLIDTVTLPDGRTFNTLFNNVSAWNGEALSSNDATGGVVQATTRFQFVRFVAGPCGTNLNNSGHLCALRFSNGSGAPFDDRTAHQTFSSYLDARAWAQITDTRRLYVTTEGGANIAHINPLWGLQGGTGGTIFTRQFGGGGTVEQYTATNPVVTDGGAHRVSFADVDVDSTNTLTDPEDARGIRMLPTTAWSNTNPPGFITSQVIDLPANGMMMRSFRFDGATGTNTVPDAVSEAILELDDFPFRKYSWRQQPTETEFGVLRTVAPPSLTAGTATTDAEITTAINTGFNEYLGQAWADGTRGSYNVDDTADPITSQTALNTPAKVAALTISNADRLVAEAKLLAWNLVTDTDINATNSKVALGYSITGTRVAFTNALIIGSATTTSRAGVDTITGLALRTSSLARGEFLTELHANASITIAGSALSGSAQKVNLSSGLNITAPASQVYQNVQFSAPAITMAASASHDNLNFDVPSNAATITFTGLTNSSSVGLSDLFGDNFGFNNGDTITLNTASTGISLEIPAASNITANSATIDGVTYTGGTNITLVTAPATVTTPLAGIVVFVNQVGGIAITLPVTTTAGGTVNIPASAGTLDIYYKPTNSYTGTVAIYPVVSVVGYTPADGSITLSASPYPDVLIGDLPGVTGFTAGTNTAGTGTASLTYTLAANATSDFSVAQSKRFLLEATDTPQYLEAAGESISASRTGTLLGEPITPGTNGTTVDYTRITLDQTAGANQQQVILRGVSNGELANPQVGQLSANLDAAAVQSFLGIPPAAGISQAEVQSGALSALTASGVTAGVTAVDNKTDYLVTDGNTTNTAYDRFVGIKPKRAVYNPTTDYTP